MPEHYVIAGLQLAGSILLIVGLGHTAFYRIFGWKEDLARISPHNATLFMTLHIGTTILLFAFGVFTIYFASQLSQPNEGASAICLALSLLWCWRLIWQIVYFTPPKIERSKVRLVGHYSLIAMFSILVIAYAAPLVARP